MSDRVTGLFGVVLALAYGIVGAGYESALMTDPLGPNTFPVLIAAVLGGCSVLLIVRPRDGALWPSARVWRRTLAAIAAMVIYGLVLEVVGFVVASFFLVLVVAVLMAGGLAHALATALITSVLLYALFDWLLGLPLPGIPILSGVFGG